MQSTRREEVERYSAMLQEVRDQQQKEVDEFKRYHDESLREAEALKAQAAAAREEMVALVETVAERVAADTAASPARRY